MHSVLPLLTFIVFDPYFLSSYKMAKASVFENVSRFGRFVILSERDTVCFNACLLAAPMPFLIA